MAENMEMTKEWRRRGGVGRERERKEVMALSRRTELERERCHWVLDIAEGGMSGFPESQTGG